MSDKSPLDSDEWFDVRTKPAHPTKFAATFPPMDVRLDRACVVEHGLQAPLEDLALALLGQHEKVNGKKPVGIRFHAVTFDFLLE